MFVAAVLIYIALASRRINSYLFLAQRPCRNQADDWDRGAGAEVEGSAVEYCMHFPPTACTFCVMEGTGIRAPVEHVRVKTATTTATVRKHIPAVFLRRLYLSLPACFAYLHRWVVFSLSHL